MIKKKWGFNSKVFSTITLVFVVCCFILTSLWSAKKIDFHSASQLPVADFRTSDTKTDYSNVDKTDSCDYCESWGENYYLWITRVELADLDNSSVQDEDGDEGGYGDYTHLTAHLIQGKTYSISLENNFGWDPLYWKVWIDYNGDCDFEDECEEVLSGSGGYIVKGTITVPCCTITGDTRMRVSMGSSPVNPIPPYGFIGNGEVEDYTVNITCNVGYNDVFCSTSTSTNRRAQPFIMPEDGTITSVTMYHEAGTGSDHMILAVYDGWGSPQNRIAVTPSTLVSTSPGWQTIDLESPVVVQCGTPIWLAWVYENNPGIRYQTGAPGRYQSNQAWSGGMPDPFGHDVTQADYIYSIYANYTPGGGEPTYKYLGYGYTKVFGQTSLSSNIQAVHVTMPENGTIRSLTMYHNSGGSSNNMRLGVYDGGASAPQYLLSEGGTPVATYACWQTIKLDPAVPVMEGTTIWLAWCYDINPGIRIKFSDSGSFQSTVYTGCPLPDPFGPGTSKNDIFMIYATYTVD